MKKVLLVFFLVFPLYFVLSDLSPCDPQICKIENECLCANRTIPVDMAVEDVPQFVFFTFDDSIKVSQFEVVQRLNFLLKNTELTDAKGCTPKISFYTLQAETDFNILNYLYNIGSSINQHGMTHTTSLNSTYDTWIYEFSTQKDEMKAFANIPEPKGSRAPYLQPNEAYYLAMAKLNIKFDSSMVNSDDKPFWPFTLDYQVPDLKLCQNFGSCPTSSHPGIWEFPLTSFDLSEIGDVMDYRLNEENYEATLKLYKDSFTQTHSSGKAPRGFYLHWRYFTNNGDFDSLNTTKVKFVQDFYGWLVKEFQDIVFATEDEIIDWLKKPMTLGDILKSADKFKCPNTNLNLENACEGGRSFTICGNNCDLVNIGEIEPWHASITLKTPLLDKWPMGFCAEYEIYNSGRKTAKAVLLTMNFCKDKGIITTQWGYSPIVTQSGISFSGIQDYINFVSLDPNAKYTLGGFCMQFYKEDFDPYTDIQFGTELYSSFLQCPQGTCSVTCGNGICELLETAVSCPSDCNILCSPNDQTTSTSTMTTTRSTSTAITTTTPTKTETTTAASTTTTSTSATSTSTPIPTSTTSTTTATQTIVPTNDGQSQQKIWVGKGGLKTPYTADWGIGFCTDLIVQNDGGKKAKMMIMVVEYCQGSAVLSAKWGNEIVDIQKANTKGFILKMNSEFEAVQDKITVGGLCFQQVISQKIKFGINFYEEEVNCIPGDCPKICGDGICDVGEVCEVDCTKC